MSGALKANERVAQKHHSHCGGAPAGFTAQAAAREQIDTRWQVDELVRERREAEQLINGYP